MIKKHLNHIFLRLKGFWKYSKMSRNNFLDLPDELKNVRDSLFQLCLVCRVNIEFFEREKRLCWINGDSKGYFELKRAIKTIKFQTSHLIGL